MEFFSVVQNPGLLLNMDIFAFFYFWKLTGSWRQVVSLGMHFQHWPQMHAVLIGDHTPNMDRSDLFQVFRTMLTNKLKQYRITRLKNKTAPWGERKKDPKYQDSLNNNFIVQLFGTVNFFHDHIQYLTKSGYLFFGANVHKLSQFGILVTDLSPPQTNFRCIGWVCEGQNTFLMSYFATMVPNTYMVFILW